VQKKAASSNSDQGKKRRPTIFEQNGDMAKVKRSSNSNEKIKTEASSTSGKQKQDYDNTGLLLLPGLPV
jgi:hypothetical protein